MRSVALMLILQSAVYGPSMPKPVKAPEKQADATRDGCDGEQSPDITVCGRTRLNRNQRLQARQAEEENPRLNLKLSDKAGVTGGGPKGKNGQAVGAGFALKF